MANQRVARRLEQAANLVAELTGTPEPHRLFGHLLVGSLRDAFANATGPAAPGHVAAAAISFGVDIDDLWDHLAAGPHPGLAALAGALGPERNLQAIGRRPEAFAAYGPTRHPNCTADLLAEIGSRPWASPAHAASVIEHPRCPTGFLARLVELGPGNEFANGYRDLLATAVRHPNISDATLELLADSRLVHGERNAGLAATALRRRRERTPLATAT